MKDRQIVIFSTSFWDAPHWFRRQHFAAGLAKRGWKVVYVEPATSMVRTLGEHGIRKLIADAGAKPYQPIPELDTLWVYKRPPALPFHVKSPLMAKLSRALSRRWIWRTLNRLLESETCIQAVYHPYDAILLDKRYPYVFDLVDRFTQYPEYAGQIAQIERYTQTLSRHATGLCATSQALLDTLHGPGKRFMVPNGVAFEHYRGARNRPVPEDLAGIHSPRVIYVGAIYEWFDMPLLHAIARDNPNMQFILLGFSKTELPELPGNVHYLGNRQWQDVPAYVAHCDVGIIPFKQGELTSYVNPLKLYEYLACEIPVVSVPMHALSEYESEGILVLANSSQTFSDAIRKQLTCAAEHRDERHAIAQNHDWEALASRFENVMEACLDSYH
jgi:glycosyltransferase involved in cell wall biosynthesis